MYAEGNKELSGYVNFVNDEDGVKEVCLICEFAYESLIPPHPSHTSQGAPSFLLNGLSLTPDLIVDKSVLSSRKVL